MTKTSTRFLQVLAGVLGLGLAAPAQAAFGPVAVTGYNADVVANGAGAAAASTSVNLDGGTNPNSFALMASTYVSPTGAVPTVSLPANGLIASTATPGLNFQLASYSANNSLRISGAGTGTLTLGTPQTAGEVYLLVTSGNGASTVNVTVTFADGTTQVFSSLSVADWFGGTTGVVTQGIGRVNRDTDVIDNNTTNPRLYQLRLAIAAANYSKQIQTIAFSKTATTGTFNVMGVSTNSLCSGTPTAGATAASVTSVCAGTSINLSLTGASGDAGLTYQWQSSINGGTTWTDISGATGTTYTATQALTTQYRARVTCGTVSATSTPVAVTSSAPTYLALPVVESFENTWVDICATRDAPSNSWRNTPSTGNPSWRREDDGASASWTSATSGGYTPAGSQGSHSARFHSYFATAGQVGTLDMYVDLSAAGNKRLTFDYINTTGATSRVDTLTVHLSTDGGVTFGPALLRLLPTGTGSGFVNQALPLTTSSATAVIRFRVNSDYGTTDVGLDNIVLESATGCLTPAGLTSTSTTTTTATLNWLAAGSGTYTVVYGLTGFNPATGGTRVAGLTAPPYTVTGLQPGTTYQFYVTQNCGGTTSSGTAGPVAFTTQIVNDEPCGATDLTVTNTCTPVSTTMVGATNTPGTVYGTGGQGTGCGSNTAPKDVWFKFTTAATGPTSTSVRISVTGTAAGVVRAYSGTACAGPLTFISCAGTSSTAAAPNLDLTALTPSTTYYVRVNPYSSTGALDNFTICASAVPNCPAPVTPAATQLTNTTATLSWSATAGTGSTFTVVYGPTGFNPATGGTTVTGITGTSTTISGLTANTPYQFYVTQICSSFNGSSTQVGPISFTTPLNPPSNDEPCGAVALSGTSLNTSNVGATTSAQNGITLPACSPASTPRDVWFTLTPSGTSTTLTMSGSAAGLLRVYSSPSCSAGPFTLVACQASSGGFTAPFTLTGLVAGQRYYVAVSGYGSSDTPGSFTVSGTNLLASRPKMDTDALLVYPNPSNTGQFTLRLSTTTTAGQATLLNALGQRVLEQSIPRSTTEQTLLTKGLAAGVYTLRVQVGDETYTRKVVLE